MTLNLEEEKKNEWDFEGWINKYKLNDMKQCFIKYKMNTFDSLNMDNENYIELISDNQILSNPHLFGNITKGILSINKLKELKQKQLTIIPQTENEQFNKIQHYIQQLNQRQNILTSTIKQQFDEKKQKNNISVNQYEKHYNMKLDDIHNNINQIFKNLENECQKNENTLKCTVECERNKIKLIAQNYKEKITNTESVLSECLSIIEQKREKYENTIKEYQHIINKYDENENKKLKYKERETEIINIGDNTNDENEKAHIMLNSKFDEINKFLKDDLKLPTFKHVSNVNNLSYDRIGHNLNGLVGIVNQNDDEKKELNDTNIREKSLKRYSGSIKRRRNALPNIYVIGPKEKDIKDGKLRDKKSQIGHVGGKGDYTTIPLKGSNSSKHHKNTKSKKKASFQKEINGA